MDLKLTQTFNKQINHQFYSAYLYFAMSTYFSEIAMEGFSKYMRHVASKKLCFAQKIYDYLILRDEKLIFQKIEEPDVDWINVSEIFSSAQEHEEFVLNSLLELYKIALDASDIGASKFICEFAQEQEKTVSKLRKFNYKIKSSSQNVIDLLDFDLKKNTLC